MGVYVFLAGVNNFESYIKLGFTKHDNPYKRINGRYKIGFNDLKHPENINVRPDDLELLFWVSNLSIQNENYFHKLFKKYNIVGEFYCVEILGDPDFEKYIMDASNLRNASPLSITTKRNKLVRVIAD